MSRFGLKPAQARWVSWSLGAASALALPLAAVHAQTPATSPSASAPSAPKQATFERGGVDQVQATTQALLDALVDGGILTRERTDALVAAAKAKAAALVPFVGPDGSMLVVPPAPAPYVPIPSDTQATGAGLPALPAVLPSASRAASEEVDKDGKKVVRIPYVSETTKKELREQVKREVLAQAKKERWGESGAFPSWLNHIQLYGDFRLREEATVLANGNTPPGPGPERFGFNVTRAADIASSINATSSVPNFNTEEDANRMRLRARLGVEATVSEDVTAALRFTTGNTTDRTSTNQTMGQSFNKYSVVFDQAYMSFHPLGPVAEFRGGRMPNPFFSTDLVWADDLGFEGLAVSGKKVFGGTSEAFATAGYFPLSEFKPGTSTSRGLLGLQAGAAFKLGSSQLKLGLAMYDYQNVAGQRETDIAFTTRPDYAVRYEYGVGFRQRGNTLFAVNAPANTSGARVYGLASDFRVLNLTSVLDLPTLAGLPLTIIADAITNIAFDRGAISSRTGENLTDGKEMGYLAKIALGSHAVRRKGEWNASLAYRYLGSDATLDAFTNSDFGLGGTNNQGFILGGNYGLYDNTVLSARWMSANQIDSYAPGSNPVTKFSVDTLQLDLAVRF